jgi:hypothetical protein
MTTLPCWFILSVFCLPEFASSRDTAARLEQRFAAGHGKADA